MRISTVRIQNFRSFEDTTIALNSYTCLVGPNGSGKSTVLQALNVFFRETSSAGPDPTNLDVQDFHQKNTDETICITVTFTDLSDEAEEDFSHYCRQGELVVSAMAWYDESSAKVEVKQYGKRLAMPAFREFFSAVDNNTRVVDLRELYATIKTQYPDLPAASTKDAMINSLREFESARPDECEYILSEDQFYGATKGSNLLAKHVQWVYVPAVKDPSIEQVESRNSSLGKLLARTVRSRVNFDEQIQDLRENIRSQYDALLQENQHVLDDVSEKLEKGLSSWAHPDVTLRLQWKEDPEKSVRLEEPTAHILAGEGDFEGDLSRFGHGLQRSYLLALLQQLASDDAGESPTLILACEEPELYQHPPQARHLARVLLKLAGANSQVVVSSHNPLFVSGEGFEDVRMVRKDQQTASSSVACMSYEQVADAVAQVTGEAPTKLPATVAKVHQALQPQLNEMFFTQRLVLVEGLEDVSYILAYFELLGRLDEYRRLGCHIVPANGKSELLQPVVLATHMNMSTYIVFDADADKEDKGGSRAKHERDNAALLSLAGSPGTPSMPDQTVWGKGFTLWHSDIESVVRDDVGIENWQWCREQADQYYGQARGMKKNELHIGARLAFAWEAGLYSSSLQHLCGEILTPQNSLPTVDG